MLHVRLVTVMLSCVLPSTAVAVVVIVFTLLRGSSHHMTLTPQHVLPNLPYYPPAHLLATCARACRKDRLPLVE